jgi:hypothetical protein
MRISPLVSLAGALALLALPSLGSAQVSFAAQQRSVEATSHSGGNLWATGTNPFSPDFDPATATYSADHSDDAQAPDFAGFDETASSPAPLLQGLIGPAASASASQTSSLSASLIAASGSFAADGDSYTIPPATLNLINSFLMPPVPYNFGIIDGTEVGDSQFSVQFDVAVPTPFHLTGSISASEWQTVEGLFGIAGASASISLTGPSGSVAAVTLSLPLTPSSDSIDESGTLAPGSYTLSANASGSAFGLCFETATFVCYDPSSSGSFDLALSLGGAPEVPGPSRLSAALLGVALAAIGAAALRRA